jgi:beta-glucosidase
VARAVRELRAFARVELAPGETRRVALEVGAADLAFWDVTSQRWVVEEEASYRALAGTSSRDLPLAAPFRIRSRP